MTSVIRYHVFVCTTVNNIRSVRNLFSTMFRRVLLFEVLVLSESKIRHHCELLHIVALWQLEKSITNIGNHVSLSLGPLGGGDFTFSMV